MSRDEACCTVRAKPIKTVHHVLYIFLDPDYPVSEPARVAADSRADNPEIDVPGLLHQLHPIVVATPARRSHASFVSSDAPPAMSDYGPDFSVRPAFTVGSPARSSPVAPTTVRVPRRPGRPVIFPLDRVAVGRFFRAPVRASSPSSPALTPRTLLRASRLFTADVPKYIFEGTEATESQRVTRGVLEHWKGVNSGAISAVPDVSAADVKRAQLKSSVGKALKFPPEILGDVYADPYPKRNRRQEARDAIARREASERAGELMKGWSQVAEQDKTMQSAFSAMKTTWRRRNRPSPRRRASRHHRLLQTQARAGRNHHALLQAGGERLASRDLLGPGPPGDAWRRREGRRRRAAGAAPGDLRRVR